MNHQKLRSANSLPGSSHCRDISSSNPRHEELWRRSRSIIAGTRKIPQRLDARVVAQREIPAPDPIKTNRFPIRLAIPCSRDRDGVRRAAERVADGFSVCTHPQICRVFTPHDNFIPEGEMSAPLGTVKLIVRTNVSVNASFVSICDFGAV